MEGRKAHNVVIFAITGIIKGILVRRVQNDLFAYNCEAIKNSVLHNAFYPITQLDNTRGRCL